MFYPNVTVYTQATKNMCKKMNQNPNDDGYYDFIECSTSAIDANLDDIKWTYASGEGDSARVSQVFNDLLGKEISENLSKAIISLALAHSQWFSELGNDFTKHSIVELRPR